MGKILIIYASRTGNTEIMAETIAEQLKTSNNKVTIQNIDFDEIDMNKLCKYDAVLLGTYTWYDGELPYEVEDLHEALSDIDLVHKIIGIFGSADSFYDTYGGAIDIMTERVRELGATVVSEPLKIDLEPSDTDIIRCRQFAKQVHYMVDHTFKKI